MGMTIAEKIIAAAAGVDSVKPGDIHTVILDRLMCYDGTTHLTVDMYNNKLKNPHIADTSKLVFIVDHNVPSDSPKTAASQKKMRDFARETNIDFWEGKGVCHQVMIENYVRPGELIFGADSHTCSYGALGAFGTGVGCTDFLYGMVTGTSWVLVPESVKFNLTGKLPEGVYARDLILTIIGEIGANGCNYQAMEFTGEGAPALSISDRMALCNMAVEAGAKTGIFEADEKAIEYLKDKTAYAPYVERMDVSLYHRGNVEKILNQSLFDDYSRIFRFAGMEQKTFLKLYWKRYEVALINYCLRIVFNHYENPIDLEYKKEYETFKQIIILEEKHRADQQHIKKMSETNNLKKEELTEK